MHLATFRSPGDVTGCTHCLKMSDLLMERVCRRSCHYSTHKRERSKSLDEEKRALSKRKEKRFPELPGIPPLVGWSSELILPGRKNGILPIGHQSPPPNTLKLIKPYYELHSPQNAKGRSLAKTTQEDHHMRSY